MKDKTNDDNLVMLTKVTLYKVLLGHKCRFYIRSLGKLSGRGYIINKDKEARYN